MLLNLGSTVKRLAFFALIVLGLVPLSIARAAEVIELNRIVAVVNEDAITHLELEKRVQTVLQQLHESNTALPPMDILRRQVLEHLIMERLQLELADERGVHIDDESLNEVITRIAAQNSLSLEQFRAVLAQEGIDFASFREDVRNDLIMNNLRMREVESHIEVTQQEVDDLISRQAITGDMDVEYHLGHILIALPEGAAPEQVQAARAKAEELLQLLREGADFRQMAVTYSAGQQALQGGDLGWRTGGQLPTLFADVVPHMKPDELSEPLRSSSGFHIVKLLDKRGEETQYITQVQARHILIHVNALVSDEAARERLLRLRERILQGEDFADLARTHSADTGSAINGGDLGWANPGTFVGPFEQALNTLQPGEISLPFETQFGWHIAQVVDRRERDSTEEIRRSRAFDVIRQRKAEEETQDWLRRLHDEAYIEFSDEN